MMKFLSVIWVLEPPIFDFILIFCSSSSFNFSAFSLAISYCFSRSLSFLLCALCSNLLSILIDYASMSVMFALGIVRQRTPVVVDLWTLVFSMMISSGWMSYVILPLMSNLTYSGYKSQSIRLVSMNFGILTSKMMQVLSGVSSYLHSYLPWLAYLIFPSLL